MNYYGVFPCILITEIHENVCLNKVDMHVKNEFMY